MIARARAELSGRSPLVVAAVLIAGAVIVYELGVLVLAALPLLFAIVHHGRGRRSHSLAADLAFAGGGFLLGRGRRRGDSRRTAPRSNGGRGEELLDELVAARIATEHERRASIRAGRRARLEAARASRDELERAYRRGVIEERLGRAEHVA